MYRNGLLFLCMFGIQSTCTVAIEPDFKSGFPVAGRMLSQPSVTFVDAWQAVSQSLEVYQPEELQKQVDLQFYTIENIRGPYQKAAYPNQDRAFAGALAGKTCFGVFDGHGKETGGVIAEFVQKYLPFKILGYKSSRVGVWKAFPWMQEKIEDEKREEGNKGGTTALVGVLADNILTIANVGDSRAIGNIKGKLVELSFDHKPTHKEEYKRITKAGGIVRNGYVFNKKNNIGFALTRSLGDLLAHDNHVISATPDVQTFSVQKGDVLVFATDGLWDVMNNKEVYDFIKKKIDPMQELDQEIAKDLAIEARKRGSRDDITVLLVVIK